MKRRETGILGEKLARDFLKQRGYHLIESNYRCPEGEIDIVAKQKDCLVFVEVRSKRQLDFGTPEESITAGKMRRLKTACLRYRQSHGNLPSEWRIDLVAVELDSRDRPTRIEIIENAVEE